MAHKRRVGANSDPERLEPIASHRHTAVLTAILLGVALAGLVALMRAGSSPAPAPPGRGGAMTYAGLLAAEWGLFFYVRAGLKRGGTSIARMVSERPLSTGRLAADAALGILLFALLLAAAWALAWLLGAGNGRLVQAVALRDAALLPLWIALSISAGFVEEVTFRGYYQRQLAALAGRLWVGLGGQALLFGVTHGYQGGILILRIVLLGLVFGLAAHWRRSLVPGIVAHAGLDIFAGLAALR